MFIQFYEVFWNIPQAIRIPTEVGVLYNKFSIRNFMDVIDSPERIPTEVGILYNKFSIRNFMDVIDSPERIPTEVGILYNKFSIRNFIIQKMASYLHHTATTIYSCCVPALGDSTGAGCVGLATAKIQHFVLLPKIFSYQL